ncbi:aminoglycoside phosphotransferase family protein, partial [bacterium]|nr:aminoglycoside phosphotransferase family protein [bacterium]
PFVYHAGDTIIHNEIPVPDNNWIGGFKSDDSSHYATLNVVGDNVISINDKGAQDFDYIHIGLVGIKDYKIFWEILEKIYNEDKNDSSLNDVSVINRVIKNNESEFKFLKFNAWLDIGNIKALRYARENIKDSNELAVLDKNNESIFIFDNFVIKFFYNKRNIAERVKRAKILKGLTPEIEGIKENFYRYKYIKGDIYSRTVRPSNFLKFLNWTENNLWKKKDYIGLDEFKNNCHDFYYEKTIKRIENMIELEQIKDKKDVINGEEISSIKELLERVDFDYLSNTEQSQFHGDFILDNIIYDKDKYCLIDWRQNFGGHLYAGDKYYDLAKLNHNLTVNHDIIKDNFFTININSNKEIDCDIMRRENLVACQKIYHNFLLEKDYDLKKVKILRALIWLNMSPLHHHPFNLFLYYFGKLNLWRTLQEK